MSTDFDCSENNKHILLFFTDTAAYVQVDPLVLQLLVDGAGAVGVPVRAQAGFPRRQQLAQPAASLAQRDALLPVGCRAAGYDMFTY